MPLKSLLLKLMKQAQICAEGCEEEYITHIFGFSSIIISSAHKRFFSNLIEVKLY